MVKIGRDKIKHFFAGLAIAIVAGLLFYPLVGLLAAAAVGALKELIRDRLLKKGTPELMDFIATVAGGVVGYALLRLI
jgi:hypothetical protein